MIGAASIAVEHEVADISIHHRGVGPRFGCFFVVLIIAVYVGLYASCVKRVMSPGSLGVFAVQSYTGNAHIDLLLCDFFYPVHLADTKLRPNHWAYHMYQGDQTK